MAGDGFHKSADRWEPTKTTGGHLVVIGLVALVFSSERNPFHELRLIQHSSTAAGQIVEGWEDLVDGDRYGVGWTHWGAYVFQLSDGREFMGRTRYMSGRLPPEFIDPDNPVPVEVEYDTTDPSINRIKGTGCKTVTEWVLRMAIVDSILAIAIAYLGAVFLRNVARALRPVAKPA
ncbi:MAG: hypothetical protein HOP29_02180 [Phycisphaerales bacterium]|nr:hypothetical protein [Phycisphaerales bacterium]